MNIYLIPDTQQKQGVRNPLIPIAHHICDVKPNVVLHGGDHWDFPSLSRYDKGKKSHRTKSFLADLRAGNEAMEAFWKIIKKRWPKYKQCQWIILEGNHEIRRKNALEYGPDELLELIEAFPMNYDNWNVVLPFLKVHKINGVSFSHYFQNDSSNRPIGTAKQLLMKRHSSRVAFHKQGFDYAEALGMEGRQIQAIIAGSCYFHNEGYKTHTNHHWRGTVVLTNVRDGMFDFARYNLQSIDNHYKKFYKK